MHIYIDTETTGLPIGNLDSPGYPWPVEIAAALTTGEHETVSSFRAVIRPDGWTIPDEVAKIHDIDTAYANRYGLPLPEVLRTLATYASAADTVLGYNVQFDLGIVASACKRLNLPNPLALRSVCVMAEVSRHLGVGRMSLGKAYEWVLKRPQTGGHTAMSDVLACRAIYAAITL